MANNITGNPGTLVPIVGPGGRLPIGPTTRNAPTAGGSLLSNQVGPPQAAGMYPVVLGAVANTEAAGFPPAQTSAPMQPAGSLPG